MSECVRPGGKGKCESFIGEAMPENTGRRVGKWVEKEKATHKKCIVNELL